MKWKFVGKPKPESEFVLAVKPKDLFGNRDFYNGVLLMKEEETMYFPEDGKPERVEFNLTEFLQRLKQGKFLPRNDLEYYPVYPDVTKECGTYTLPEYIQPVVWNIVYYRNPYGAVYYYVSDIPERTVEDVGKGAVLRNQVNLGWGGHIGQRADRRDASALELLDFTGLDEIHDELEILRLEDILRGVIYMRSDPVSVRHLGIWRTIRVRDLAEVGVKKEEKKKSSNARWIIPPGWFYPEAESVLPQNLATWSRAIITPLKETGCYSG